MGNFRKKAKAYVKKQARRAGSWAKKRYMGKGGLSNIVKDISLLKTALNVEKKHLTVGGAATSGGLTYSNPYAYMPFDDLTNGSGFDQRIGDQVKMLYGSWRIHLELNATAGTTVQRSTMYRIMAVMDMEPRGDAPLTASQLRDELLADTSTARGQIVSYYRLTGQVGDRFKIVRDFRVRLDDVTQRQKFVNININFTKMFPGKKGHVVKYDAENDPVNTRLYILLLSDDPNAFGTGYTDHFITNRITFVDN